MRGGQLFSHRFFEMFKLQTISILLFICFLVCFWDNHLQLIQLNFIILITLGL